MKQTKCAKQLSCKRQTGATMWTTLSIGLMIGFIAYLAFMLIPVYIDHSIIRGSMQEIANQSEFKQMTSKQILIAIQKRTTIDNIRGFSSDAFKVSREKSGQRFIVIDYSKKVSLFGNVSALVEFKEEVRTNR